MAGRKVLRDIRPQPPEDIWLREITEESLAASRQKNIQLTQQGAVDCSVSPKKGVRQNTKQTLQDVQGSKGADESREKVLFLQIGQKEETQKNHKWELIRLSAAGLVIVLLLNIVNVYYKGLEVAGSVIAAADAGYEDLINGAQQTLLSDYTGAQGNFEEAKNTFETTLETLSFLGSHRDWFLVKDKTAESAQGVLEAAKDIAEAGGSFSKGVESLSQLPALLLRENGLGAVPPPAANTASENLSPPSLTEKLKYDLTYLDAAYASIESAQKNLGRVDASVLPPTFRERFNAARQQVDDIHGVLTRARQRIPALLDLLGDKYPHRYLILLQNDTEARPTGGFIGSYIIADLNDGYLTKMEFHDVYELDGQLQENITPPPDIAKVSDNWRMRDSNYSPDFAISAEKAAWFFQKQGGSSVDTVIAINQSFIEDLLQLTGPLQLSSLNAPLTPENFQLILSYIIENKLTGEESPKLILQQLIPAFQKKLFTDVPLDQTAAAFLTGARNKKILFYSRKEEVQQMFSDLSWSGRTMQTPKTHDYLNVVNVSIGGNKSDRYIQQTVRHNTLINPNGEIIDEVSVTRKHTWSLKDLEGWRATLKQFGFSYLSDGMADLLGRGTNKSFVKLYVPLGSELLGSEGVRTQDITTFDDEETRKTWFMFQLDVAPSQQQTVTIRYKIPTNLSFVPADTYRLQIQTQPAINPTSFEKNIFLKPGLKPVSQYPEGFKQAGENSSAGLAATYASPLDTDLYLSALTTLR